jgi:hypothetical protein
MQLFTASDKVSNGIPPKPTRLRFSSYGAVHLSIHPCRKPQGILAKANNFWILLINCLNNHIINMCPLTW